MSTTTCAQRILSATADDSAGPSGAELPAEYWELLERYRAELTAQALAILGNPADADDAVQETFCEFIRTRRQAREVKSLGAWLRTANKRNALNRLRAGQRRKKHSDRLQREAPRRAVTTGGFSKMELREMVARAIEQLPPRYRRPVTLRYWENLSCEETAERLGLPVGTVKWQLFEAVAQLHAILAREIERGTEPHSAEGGLS
ncbi:MAG: RNA polymerase sigma factor [Planctomycetota bacterium]|nr:RNA polymerase sigma factor [Planctomycetota bacterium]